MLTTGLEDDVEMPVFEYMAIQGGSKLTFKRPIHENMTLAVLIHSKYRLDQTITFEWLRTNPEQRPEVNDFIRGVVWNDDPAGLLFEEKRAENLIYSTAALFGTQFLSAKNVSWLGMSNRINIIGRSHFWDMQFLHGMGSSKNEAPTETKRKILMWLQIMYNIAMDPTSTSSLSDTSIGDISSKVGAASQLRDFFDKSSDPPVTASVRTLITRNHASPAHMQHRAMGSCFHVIQDSYAHGHTRRVLLNPQDKVDPSSAKLEFKPGCFDRWGAVQNFHTYKGQNSGDHAEHDHTDADMSRIHPADLDSFNHLLGVRYGVEQCIKLTNFWRDGVTWEAGVGQWFADEVFAIASDATGSDTSV